MNDVVFSLFFFSEKTTKTEKKKKRTQRRTSQEMEGEEHSRKLRHGSPVIYWKNQGGDLSSEDLTRTS